MADNNNDELSQSTSTVLGSKRKITETSPPAQVLSSFPSHGPASPLALTANTTYTPIQPASHWLQTVISPLPPHPSSELKKCLLSHSAGNNELYYVVITRANIISTAIFPNSPLENIFRLHDINFSPEQKRTQALKLYYKVLESICEQESQSSNVTELSRFLNDDRFHRGLLACSAQLVWAAHTASNRLLPAVLERTGITPFDLSRVIEIVIIQEHTLPRRLRRHLNSLEEQLLESRVWERGSSLYNFLIVARPNLSDEINRLGLLAKSMPPLASHIRRGQDGNVNSPNKACTSPTRQNLPRGQGACTDTALNIFFTKMKKLAAIRIHCVAERLNLCEHNREKIFLLFERILNQKTSLFFNRHLDQIIPCCFFGVGKVSGLDLTFEKIIKYRSHAHHYVATNRSKNKEDWLNIIEFYEKIFVPSVKYLVKDFHSSGATTQVEIKNDDDPHSSNQMSPFRSLPDFSPKKVSPVQNVYLSPLQLSKKDALNSNMSKSYYASFGGSPSEYKSPSKQLSEINKALNGTRKPRRKLNFDNAGATMISDSVVVNSLFFTNHYGV